MYDIQVV